MSGRAPMITVSAGLVADKHVKAMGPAIWEYLGLLDWQTSQEGTVRGGNPVTIQQLTTRIGHSPDTIYRNLARLEHHGYIQREKGSAGGWIIHITKAKKWFSERRKNAKPQPQDCETEPQKCVSDSQICDRSSQKCDSSNEVRIQTNTERGGGKTAPPAYRCSHGDCSHPTYHAARIVAQAQGLNFPDDVGSLPRWLKESKALTKYADNDITEFVEFKIKRESPKWDSQLLRPSYVAEDITVFLRKRESDVGTKPNGHDETGFWISDRERDRRLRASEEGQAA